MSVNSPSAGTAITAVALANHLGTDTDAVWKALTGPVTAEPVRSGSYPAPDHQAIAAGLTSRIKVRTDPTTQVALHLADRLVDSVGTGASPYDTGVMLANTFGGLTFGQREIANLYQHGPAAVSPFQSFAWFFAVNTGQVSIRHAFKGPSGTVVTEACGGLDAIGQAGALVAEGQPRMVAGAVDGTSSPFGVALQYSHPGAAPAPAPGESGPKPAGYQPLSTRAAGHVPGEAGCLVMVEDLADVRQAGRQAYATLAGYRSAFCPEPDQTGAIEQLLRDVLGEVGDPGEVGVVFADGLAAPGADRQEAEAIVAVWGERGVPVTVPKGRFGRCCAAGSATDAGLAALCLHTGWIPFADVRDPLPGLDLVTAPRPLERPLAVVLSRGYGGFLSALALAAVPAA